jgi:arylsulfatase A-like enzyme
MVSCVDDGVGRVMESLRRHNIEDETIVVFLSDNGGAITKNASNNGALRGAKSDLFEGGIRVPFAMQWKNTIPAGLVYSHPVISLDIMATITELAGVKIAEDRPLDGVNLLPYLTGKNNEAPHDQLFWRKWEHQGMCIRDGDTKLVANTQRQKNSYQLFNVEEDLSETKNLRKQSPEKSKELLEAWEAWNDQLKDRTFPTLMADKWWERL